MDIVSGGGTSTLTVGNNNASGEFGGIIRNTTGSLSLIKVGTGTQVLSGTGTYSGATKISAGFEPGQFHRLARRVPDYLRRRRPAILGWQHRRLFK